MNEKLIAIQVGAVSFMDEGVEQVLDTLSELGAVNTIFLASFTYTRDTGGTIAMASSPIISYHGHRKYLDHEGYGIPYRCLLPKDLLGLMVAGRCMSSDQRAYESWRAMAHVMAIGEAAGTAAALSVSCNVEPEQLDIKLLQRKLIEQGAEIGQGKQGSVSGF